MKLLVLLCGEDEDNLQIAAAGALAMLTAAQKKLCTKLPQVVSAIMYGCASSLECGLVVRTDVSGEENKAPSSATVNSQMQF